MKKPGWPALIPALGLTGLFFWSLGYGVSDLAREGIFQALELYSPGGKGFLSLLSYALPGALGALVLGTFWAWGVYRTQGFRRVLNQSYWVFLVLPPVTVGFFLLLVADAFWPGVRHGPQGSWAVLVTALTLKEGIFCGLMVLGALVRIDPRLWETARSLGSSFQAFRKVFLPLILKPVGMAFLLIFLYSLGSWEIPTLLAPTQPKPWPVLIYQAWTDGGTGITLAARGASALLIILQFTVLLGYFFMLPGRPGRKS